jgi:hypothetical protein
LVVFTFYDTSRRKSFKKIKIENDNFEILKFSEILAYLGTICGIILFVISDLYLLFSFMLVILDTQKIVSNVVLSIFGIALGLTVIIKPFYDESKISIIGILIALISSIIITILIPDSILTLINGSINPKELLFFILLLTFVIILILIAFFTEKIIFISSFLSWPPIDLMISILCFTIGFIFVFTN